MTDFNEKGLEYLRDRAYEKAAEAFNAAIEADPDNPLGYTNFGNLFLAIHQEDQALVFYEKAAGLDETYAAAFYGAGNAHYQKENYEAALSAFQNAMSLGIDGADLHFMTGLCYSAANQPLMALVHLQRAAELAPVDAEILFQYGLCLAKLGHTTLAKNQFEQVLAEDATHADAHYNLGVIAVDKASIAEAEALFKKALHFNEEHALAADALRKLRKKSDGQG